MASPGACLGVLRIWEFVASLGLMGLGIREFIQSLALRVQGLGIRWFIQSLGFRAWDMGQSLGFRDLDLGVYLEFRVYALAA